MRAAIRHGHSVDWPCEGRVVVRREAVRFHGDIPPGAGTEHAQRRLVFEPEPPNQVEIARLTYTHRGMGWIDGHLDRRACFEEIGPRHLLDLPGAPRFVFDEATVLQSQTPRTYGDWCSEHLPSLSRAVIDKTLVEPLLLPAWWLQRPYVQRDLAVLGIRAESVTSTVLIRTATVLQKVRPGHYWGLHEAEKVRHALRIAPQPSRPGSAIYLSRKGERGEGLVRAIDNDLVEDAMHTAGVTVARTARRTQASFAALASEADTVFFDHGSALYNMLAWRPRRIVELYSPEYWDSSFLFFSHSLSLSDYHVWQIDGTTSVASLVERIERLRAVPPT